MCLCTVCICDCTSTCVTYMSVFCGSVCAHKFSLFTCVKVLDGEDLCPMAASVTSGAGRWRVLAFTLEGSLEQAHPLAGHPHSPFVPWTFRPSWLLAGWKTKQGKAQDEPWVQCCQGLVGATPAQGPRDPLSTCPLCHLLKHQPGDLSALVFSH